MYLKVFSTNSKDVCTSILLNLNKANLLFGVSEGTQRFSKFKGIREHLKIFIPHYTYSTLGGTIGTLLTFRDQANSAKKPMSYSIYTSSSSIPHLSSMKNFLSIEENKIQLCALGSTNIENPVPSPYEQIEFKDANAMLYQIPVQSTSSPTFSTSYIIETIGKKHIDKDKIAKYAISGKEIQLINSQGKLEKNGNTITRDMIMSDDQAKNKVSFLLFIPSQEYLVGLIKSKLYSFNKPDKIIDMVYISISQKALLDPAFEEILKNLAPARCIAIDCQELNNISKVKSVELVNSLHYLFPSQYPLLKAGITSDEDRKSIINKFQKYSKSSIVFPAAGGFFSFGKDSINYETDSAKYDSENIKKRLHECVESISKIEKTQLPFKNNPKLVFLGTASQKPSALRNVSSIHVMYPSLDGILMDVGENTYGQMLDHYGEENLLKILAGIRIVFISHSHGDHNLGVGRLLIEIEKAQIALKCLEPMYIVCSNYTAPYISSFQSSYGLHSIILVNISDLYPSHHKGIFKAPTTVRKDRMHRKCHAKLIKNSAGPVKDLLTYAMKRFGINELYTVEVDHIDDSHAIYMKCDEWSIAYTGDTTRCANLCNHIQAPTLLIHENTEGNEEESKALNAKHSNNQIAYEHIDKIKPAYTIFTHFSQRYSPALPQLPKTANKVFCSFDHLEFSMSDLEYMSKCTTQLESASSILDEFLDSRNDD